MAFLRVSPNRITWFHWDFVEEKHGFNTQCPGSQSPWFPILLWPCALVSLPGLVTELGLSGIKLPPLRREGIEKVKKQMHLCTWKPILLISDMPFRGHFLLRHKIHLSRVDSEVSSHYGSSQLLICVSAYRTDTLTIMIIMCVQNWLRN